MSGCTFGTLRAIKFKSQDCCRSVAVDVNIFMKLNSHKSVNCVIVQGVEGTIYKEGRVILPINTADNEFATLPITPWARVEVVGARTRNNPQA